MGLLNPGGPIAQFKRNRCSISPVEVILLSGVRTHSGYPRAIDQIKAFVDDKKDIADIADLRDFCSADALSRVVDGFKGFAAAFSAKSTPSDRLISAITAKDSFQELLKYEEVILVAVNL